MCCDPICQKIPQQVLIVKNAADFFLHFNRHNKKEVNAVMK